MMNAKMKVDGIFLDLDGTIVDSKEAYIEALKTALIETGQRSTKSKTVSEIPKRLEQNLPIDDLTGGIDVRKFLKTYLETYYRVTASKARPMVNVSEVLQRLSGKAKLAIITMRHVPKKRIIDELQKFGLAMYIQYVITALDTRDPKPSPEAIIKCAKHLGVRTCRCLVVGDSVSDIRAGKAAGAMTVAVLSGIFSREELEKEKPDLIIESISKLPDFLE